MLTCLRDTYWAIWNESPNCLTGKYLRSLVVVQYHSPNNLRCPNIPKFTLQNSVWLTLISEFLEVISNKPYDRVEIRKFYERLCLYFCDIKYLFFCWISQIQDILTTFSKHLRRTSLSENIACCLTSTSFPG